MEFLGFMFGFLGFVTATMIFDPGTRRSSDLLLTIIGNAVALALWSLFAVVRKRSKNPRDRENVLVYWIVLPMVFYLSGFGYGVYSTRH
jgi:4-amino-4-deoxy-L-arabinose transferase-like glycosyltransferase